MLCQISVPSLVEAVKSLTNDQYPPGDTEKEDTIDVQGLDIAYLALFRHIVDDETHNQDPDIQALLFSKRGETSEAAALAQRLAKSHSQHFSGGLPIYSIR